MTSADATRSSGESRGASAPARATSSGPGSASAPFRDPSPLLCSAVTLLHLEALTRDGAAHAVKRAARSAGLIGNVASRSMRAGFVTDALDAGAIREQVQHHGRWTNVSSIDPYYRKTQVWGTNNPSSRQAAGE